MVLTIPGWCTWVLSGTFRSILLATSADGGGTFGPPVGLTGLNGNPAIAATGDNVYLAWVEAGTDPNNNVSFIVSANKGSTFGSSVDVSKSPEFEASPGIAVSGNNVYIVWHQAKVSEAFNTYFARSTDGGLTFGAPRNLSGGAGAYPSVAAFGDNVYVTWSDGAKQKNKLLKSVDHGVTFSEVSHQMPYSQRKILSASGSKVYFASNDKNAISVAEGNDHGQNFNAPVDTTLGTPDFIVTRSADIGASNGDLFLAWRETVKFGSVFGQAIKYNAATAPKGLVHSVEFTQAIQVWQTLERLKADLNNDGLPPVPITAGKPAVMRVYASQFDSQTQLTLTMTFEEPGGGFTNQEFVILGPDCSPEDRRNQPPSKPKCKSVEFYFTPPAGAFTVTLDASTSAKSEQHVFNITGVEMKPLNIVGLSVCLPGCSHATDIASFMPVVRKLYPNAEVNLLYRPGTTLYPTAIPPVGNLGLAVIANSVFARRVSASAVGDDDIWYGIIRSSHAPESGGFAYPFTRASVGVAHPLTDTTIRWTEGAFLLAHEMGHNLGLKHAPCGDPAGVDGDWPNGTNPNAELAEVGFDVALRKVLRPVIDPVDLMSYCEPVWVTVYTYNSLISKFRVSPKAGNSDPVPRTEGQFWQISGTISNGALTLFPVFELQTSASTASSTGSHRIEVRDASESVLFTRFFNPESAEFKDLTTPPFFSELVPVGTSSASILVFDSGGAQLKRLDVGGSDPAVNIDFPVGGETLSGSQTLTWTVTDPDSASHTYRLQYSADNGSTWVDISGDIASSTLTVNFDDMPGSPTARLRVFASDGINTGAGMSEAFTVPLSLPKAIITSPVEGDGFRQNETVWLQGVGFDADDGILSGSDIQWQSDKDGALGTSTELLLKTLSVGKHTITLTATDSDNNNASDSINITITDRPLTEIDPQAVPGATVWGAYSIGFGFRPGLGLLRSEFHPRANAELKQHIKTKEFEESADRMRLTVPVSRIRKVRMGANSVRHNTSCPN
jgi:hypothetical protein